MFASGRKAEIEKRLFMSMVADLGQRFYLIDNNNNLLADFWGLLYRSQDIDEEVRRAGIYAEAYTIIALKAEIASALAIAPSYLVDVATGKVFSVYSVDGDWLRTMGQSGVLVRFVVVADMN